MRRSLAKRCGKFVSKDAKQKRDFRMITKIVNYAREYSTVQFKTASFRILCVIAAAVTLIFIIN